jgi:hypothetical protein
MAEPHAVDPAGSRGFYQRRVRAANGAIFAVPGLDRASFIGG